MSCNPVYWFIISILVTKVSGIANIPAWVSLWLTVFALLYGSCVIPLTLRNAVWWSGTMNAVALAGLQTQDWETPFHQSHISSDLRPWSFALREGAEFRFISTAFWHAFASRIILLYPQCQIEIPRNWAQADSALCALWLKSRFSSAAPGTCPEMLASLKEGWKYAQNLWKKNAKNDLQTC